MQLLAAWKDSLTIFKPESLKLFSLATLNSLGQTYKIWLRYWGWLLLAGAGSFYFRGLTTPVHILIYITMFLSVRPSVRLKNYAYFSGYIPQGIYIGIWKAVTPVILLLIIPSIKVLTLFVHDLRTLLYVQVSIYLVLSIIFNLWVSAFYALFVLDSQGRISDAFKSLLKALKMFVYNLPFCLIMSVFAVVLIIGGSYVVPNKPFFGYYFLHVLFEFLIFLPLFANIVTNFYVKKVHEQFSVYFGAK